MILPLSASGQVLSSKGRFSVAFDRGCSPMTVNITALDAFGSITRQYFYFDGAGITNSETFTYQDPGTYQIVQVIGTDDVEDKTDTLVVHVLDAIKPSVIFKKCNGGQVFVTSTDTYYDSVRVYFTAVDSATLTNGQQSVYGYNSIDTQTIQLMGMFNNADEVCTVFQEEFSPTSQLIIPEIQSASIKETCKDFFSLYLELGVFDTLTNYRVNLIQNGSSSRLYDGFLNQSSIVFPGISFVDSDFCINIESFDPCDATSDFSVDFCDTPSELSLSPFQSLYSSYDSSGIYINLDEVNTGIFNIYRRLEEEEFDFRSDQTGSFIDPVGSNGRKYFYRIDYVDSCNQTLFTAETNPPFVDAQNISTNTYLVDFTAANNSLSGVVENEYQTGNSFSQSRESITTSPFTAQLNAKDGSPRQFITATSTYPDGIILLSNSATVRHELVLYVPNAFTPNDDGLNDTLEIFGLPTVVATTNIYNRWGQRVYSSDQPSPGWDGIINGNLAEEGTYLYEIIFETGDGSERTQRGTFALIKK